MKKTYSQEQAAEIIGISRQCLTNYINSGLCGATRTCGTTRLSQEDIDTFKQNHVNVIKPNLEALQTLSEQTIATRRRIKAKLREQMMLKRTFLSRTLLGNAITCVGKMGLIDDREALILNDYFVDELDIDNTAAYLNLSVERVLQLMRRAFRKLEDTPKLMAEMQAELEHYKEREIKHKMHIKHLEGQIANNNRIKDIKPKILSNHKYYNVLKSKVKDYNLSVRALKTLDKMDIVTIADLVQHPKMDFLKVRNSGKKTLSELDDLVTALNLDFGMNLYE